jgi:hypothetical protein
MDEDKEWEEFEKQFQKIVDEQIAKFPESARELLRAIPGLTLKETMARITQRLCEDEDPSS